MTISAWVRSCKAINWAKLVGSKRSSWSTKATYSPMAMASPALRLSPGLHWPCARREPAGRAFRQVRRPIIKWNDYWNFSAHPSHPSHPSHPFPVLFENGYCFNLNFTPPSLPGRPNSLIRWAIISETAIKLIFFDGRLWLQNYFCALQESFLTSLAVGFFVKSAIDTRHICKYAQWQ